MLFFNRIGVFQIREYVEQVIDGLCILFLRRYIIISQETLFNVTVSELSKTIVAFRENVVASGT